MLKNAHLLIIGFNFPEPNSSAAGSRMMQLIRLFQQKKWKITFATPAQNTKYAENLEELEIAVESIFPNDEKAAKVFKKINPEVVIFDRFMMEEQFGWKIAETCPKALRILDTEDLHFLRKARHQAVKQSLPIEKADFHTVLAKREIASVLRSDLTLIISEAEQKILLEEFKINANLLWYLPFLENPLEENFTAKFPDFEERKNIMFIGNYLHAPNYDAVLYLKNKIWPIIYQQNPTIKMLIYGAYPPQKLKNLENKKQNFFIKGRAENLEKIFQKSRLLLAPLKFGAGLKGKFFDAIKNGTPSITTPIGVEGISEENLFNGKIGKTPEELAKWSLTLYQDAQQWKKAQQKGREIINSRFVWEKFENPFFERLNYLLKNRENHRKENFMGQLLMHHRQQSTKYMSRWIEEKNKK